MNMVRIAVVVLDTLRKDTFEKHFDWLSGLKLTNAYSTSHWTLPAHASLFTGEYPSLVGTHAKSPTLSSGTTLAELFDKAGFKTRMWTANLPLAYTDGFRRGFQNVKEPSDLRQPGDTRLFDWYKYSHNNETSGILGQLAAINACIKSDAPTLPSLRQGVEQKVFNIHGVDDDGASTICDILSETSFGSDEFLFINLMESHAPYDPPEEYNTAGEALNVLVGDAFANSIENKDELRQAYDDAARYLSSIYKEIHADLIKNFDYVLTLSDHGELLGERGLWNHGFGLNPELTHIPVVLSGVDIDDEVEHNVASMIDIHATICELGNIQPSSYSRGKSILSSEETTSRIVEYHGFLPWHKDQFKRKGVEEIFDSHDQPFDGIVTPDGKYGFQSIEEGEIISRGDIDELPSILSKYLDQLPDRTLHHEKMDVSDEIMSQLEDLGYA